ncbi:MAG: hypothetical protein L0323_19130, partial [Planctomycetes bacterium]|nr:hypothetical protein [Planctomycetota bacterium]
MKLEEIVERVQVEWRPAFRALVETGEADEGFLQYLEEDVRAMGAVELAFGAQAQALERVGRAIAESAIAQAGDLPPASSVVSPPPAAESVSMSLARAIEDVLSLPAEDRDRAAADVASVLRSRLAERAKGALEALAAGIQTRL